MFSKFFPEEHVSSIYDVDFNKLYDDGFRAVLFDVDNTLVPHNAPADDRAKRLFCTLHNIGFKTMLISNNAEPRVRDFCDAVGAEGYIFKAGKPSPRGYQTAMERLGCDTRNTLFAGDQIFTDILGAKNAGIRTIMVEPVLKWHEEPQIILKRFLEAIVLFFYNRQRRETS